MHQHCRGPWFEAPFKFEFFRPFFPQLDLSSAKNCEDHTLKIHFNPQFTDMNSTCIENNHLYRSVCNLFMNNNLLKLKE